ncbi:MAG: tetraacyldisaccharide 4'-kinase [Candidatus Rokuibacteriota bacterium]|nr:MAG: tetraacyldisaccharide 4'-kinase [Candidatus Rokubacteria bacterium]
MSDLSARVTRAWQRGVGPAGSRVLGVAAGGYRGLLGTRDWLYARGVLKCRGLGVPVVSVGNLTVGGTGKTPAVELAVRTLMELGHRPAVVSRGYGRRGHGIQVVADAASIRLDADEGGDEPFLLARRLPGVPVVVGAHRYEAGPPAVELAVRTLMELGHRPAVVSRGYGRRGHGIQVVADAASIRLDADEGGDEPFLLARRLPGVPVVVGAHRYEAGRHAVERFGVSAIVLDDGFQHRTLAKDLEIVMARARAPWGSARLLPGGPLREPLAALARAHLIVVTGARGRDDVGEVAAAARVHAPGVPILAARHVPTECWEAGAMRYLGPEALRGLKLFAFAGIGSPDGFRQTLEDTGALEAGFARFADHHWYTREEVAALEQRALAASAVGLVTTEKDWARLRRLPPRGVPLYVLAVRLALLSGAAQWRAAFARACPAPSP